MSHIRLPVCSGETNASGQQTRLCDVQPRQPLGRRQAEWFLPRRHRGALSNIGLGKENV
jgi:hypothetical protein